MSLTSLTLPTDIRIYIEAPMYILHDTTPIMAVCKNKNHDLLKFFLKTKLIKKDQFMSKLRKIIAPRDSKLANEKFK